MSGHELQGERRLFTAEQVRALDACAIGEHGINGFTLMRRAARAAFDVLQARWPDSGRISVFCGGGNNGGDGYLVAALARQSGREVDCIWLSGPDKLKGDAAGAHAACLEAGIEPRSWQDVDPADIDADVIVDAMLGTGLDREVKGAYADAITTINGSAAPVLAVDIPSGLGADTGAEMGVAVRAEVTPSFIGLKRGLFTGAGPACAGDVVYSDLGVPPEVLSTQQAAVLLLDKDDLARWLPRRRRDAHKGKYGHVLAIGGDHGMSGAIRMTAEAALRSGTGLVSVATRREHAAAITQQRPEIMCRGVEDQSDLTPLLARASVIVIGPGLGEGDWGRAMLDLALKAGLPLVLDADALNLVAELKLTLPADCVITPHPGEAGRLADSDGGGVQRDRFAVLERLRALGSGTTVLKGAGSLIAGSSGIRLCPYGNPGMAVGGMGDLLCGVIAAFLAQGMHLEDAAACGVLSHALAGDRAAAAGERGLLPGDLLPELRQVVNPPVPAAKD